MIHKSRLFLRLPIQKNQAALKGTAVLDGHSLTLEQLSQLATGRAKITIAESSWNQIHQARAIVERLCNSDTPYFGINTGVGIFANKKIPLNELKEFQLDLIRSHATGIGEVLPLEASRRIHSLRINSLAKGFSGISPSTLKCLIDLFNSGCVPQIPHCGTVGASGDLVPLSHIGLNLIGEGELWNPNTQQYEDAGSAL
jgi:histidine ammonia-lyase